MIRIKIINLASDTSHAHQCCPSPAPMDQCSGYPLWVKSDCVWALSPILGHFSWLLSSFPASPWKPLAFLRAQPPSLEQHSSWDLGAVGQAGRGFSPGLLSLSGIQRGIPSIHVCVCIRWWVLCCEDWELELWVLGP